MKTLFIILVLALTLGSCSVANRVRENNKTELISGKIVYVVADKGGERIVVMRGAKNECIVIYDVPMDLDFCDLKEIPACHYKGTRYYYKKL